MRALGTFTFIALLLACGQNKSHSPRKNNSTTNQGERPPAQIDSIGNTVQTRFKTPDGYLRLNADSSSFTRYLRRLPLKPNGAVVSYYNGEIKPNSKVYDAVVDLPIGKRDLHQCADAVMRLRADYLFQTGKFNDIHFNFTNGFNAEYAQWRKGKRIVVNGNQVFWKQKTRPSDSPKDFWKYLEMVFSYAGTASLEKEMKFVGVEEMEIGDVFIKGGFPGHAVIIVDMAINEATNEKVFLLAQSYMPAQEIQILKNPKSENLSPWYSLSAIGNELETPEWKFG